MKFLHSVLLVFMAMACGGLTPGVCGQEQGAMIVILPDTQNYVEWKRSGVSEQMDWILANQVASNIVFVGHVGDVVNDYDTHPDQWAFMQQEYHRLAEQKIPYAVLPGNHDYKRGSRDSRMMNRFLPHLFTDTEARSCR